MTMPESQRVTVAVDGHTITLSRLDKVLYPATGTTKAEVVDYYARVYSRLAPQVAGRPLTRRRWPDGVGSPTAFYEKNLSPGTPDWVSRATLETPGSSRGLETLTFPVVDSLAALTWMANLAVLELHTPQWCLDVRGEPTNPTRLVIDLDPGEPAGLTECARVACWLRERLADDGLAAQPVTSGSKGMQLYAALDGTADSRAVSEYTKNIAHEASRATDGLVTATMSRAARRGRVLLDHSQNSATKTTITPYSLRGREHPTVAAPRTWAEVEDGERLAQLTFAEVLERLDDVEPPDPGYGTQPLP